MYTQDYLRESSIRALFQCIPRKQRPWMPKEKFVEFICGTHTSPNRRHYALRLKELLTIIEDKWKTKEAEKKRVAEQRALAREEKRRKRREERERKKQEKAEAKRRRELEKAELKRAKEEERNAKLEAERIEKERAEQAERDRIAAEEAEKVLFGEDFTAYFFVQ